LYAAQSTDLLKNKQIIWRNEVMKKKLKNRIIYTLNGVSIIILYVFISMMPMAIGISYYPENWVATIVCLGFFVGMMLLIPSGYIIGPIISRYDHWLKASLGMDWLCSMCNKTLEYSIEYPAIYYVTRPDVRKLDYHVEPSHFRLCHDCISKGLLVSIAELKREMTRDLKIQGINIEWIIPRGR